MGEETVTTDGEAVANGSVAPTKSNNDVSEKKDGKGGVEVMCEGIENETTDKDEKVNVDKKVSEVSKDEKEEKVATDSKEGKEGAEDMCEDTKNEVKDENGEVKVNQKDVEVSKDEKEEEKVVTNSEDGKEGVEETCEDTKNEVKDTKEEVNVDHKDIEVSKDDEEEEKEETDGKEEGEDERKEEAKNDAMEVDDVGNANEETDDKIEESAVMEHAGSKKYATKKSGGEKGKSKKAPEEKKKNDEPKTPVGFIVDRPVRERKSVERLVAIIEQDTSRDFHVEKGRGTALKDIPNVAYKLSKKKVIDDTLKQLHTVLFVRRGKASQIKSNILQFSGFVWHENEEKQKAKVHEKLDKIKKEKLFEFCDVLDLPITRTTAKKEDVIAKLIDFLLVPHATTSVSLAEKEQPSKGSKRKRSNSKSASTFEATPSKDSAKKSKRASKEQKRTPESEDSEEEQEDGNNGHQNGGPVESESEEHVSEPESEEEENKKRKRGSKKSSSKMELASITKSKKEATPKKSNPQKKTATVSPTIQSKSKDQSESQPPTKTFSRKKKDHVVDEKALTSKKSASKEKTEKKAAKEDSPKAEKLKPSDEELKTAICEILKVADFNTVTFTDILKQLNDRFNTELMPRKATLKSIIKEELTKIANEENDALVAVKTRKETSTQKA